MRGWLLSITLFMGLAMSSGVFAKPSVRTLRKQCRRWTLQTYNKCMNKADKTVVQCRRSCRKLPRDVGGCVVRCHRLLRRQKVTCRRQYRKLRRACRKNPRRHKQGNVDVGGRCVVLAAGNYRRCIRRTARSRRACRRACAADCPIHHPCRVRCRKLYRVHDQLCFQAYQTLVNRCKTSTKSKYAK